MPPKTGSAVSSPIQRRFTYFFQATSTEASGRARNQTDKTSLGTRIKRPPIDYNSPRSCRTRGPAIAAHLVLRVVYPVLDTAGVARYWTRERERRQERGRTHVRSSNSGIARGQTYPYHGTARDNTHAPGGPVVKAHIAASFRGRGSVHPVGEQSERVAVRALCGCGELQRHSPFVHWWLHVLRRQSFFFFKHTATGTSCASTMKTEADQQAETRMKGTRFPRALVHRETFF